MRLVFVAVPQIPLYFFYKNVIYGFFHILQPTVKKLIEISQLETILTVLQNVEEAVDYVFIEEIERDLRHSDED